MENDFVAECIEGNEETTARGESSDAVAVRRGYASDDDVWYNRFEYSSTLRHLFEG